MPRASLPPTPAPSTDIAGRSDANFAQLDPFKLPPAAIAGPNGAAGSSRASTSSSSAASNASDSSYRPVSPASPAGPAPTKGALSGSRKRSSAGQTATKDDYTLPPPPTRSRKIIQMKPRAEGAQDAAKSQAPAQASQAAPKATASAGAGKRKQGNAATAAGRKIARKTAHSLIERRRRSKMNEEFATLKDMIPACAGQEMHKLAILQASIEYMRYLERCVSDLKASHDARQLPCPDPAVHASSASASASPSAPRPRDGQHPPSEDCDPSDEEMSDAVSPCTVPAPPPHPAQAPSASPRPEASPALAPQAERPRGHALSASAHTSPTILPSACGSRRPSYAFSSAQPSPVFAGQPQQGASNFSLTPPALPLQPGSAMGASRDDHEAMNASTTLLMLNLDRRASTARRGMSVQDLLSG